MSYGQDDATPSTDFVSNRQAQVTKITLKTPLVYYHAGVKLTDEFGKPVDTRAAVGNLNRNIVIKGVDEG